MKSLPCWDDLDDLMELQETLSCVSKNLYISGSPTEKSVLVIRSEGISNMLNVAGEEDPGPILRAANVGLRSYAHLPFADCRPMPSGVVNKALRRLHVMMESGGKTLVFCGMGISRSPAIVALYWMATGEAASFKDALAKIRAVRRGARPHKALITQQVVDVVNSLRLEWAQ